MAHTDIHCHRSCEVLVVGSGIAGICAAIQAGRSGRDTILLEKDEVLGGNCGPNLGVGITGAERYHAYAVETGILQELREEGCRVDAMTHTGRGAMGYSISRRFEAVIQAALRAAGVTVLKRHYARAPLVTADRIVGVIAEDLAAFRTVQIDVSGCVIEASGDGEIGALAGADFDMGSEAHEEFGERSAGPERSHLVQGTSLVAIAHRTEQEVHYTPPAGTSEFTPRVWHGSIGSFIHHHGGWLDRPSGLMFLYVTETGGHLDTIRDDSAIYERLLDQLWAEWDHLKNGPHREEARCWDLLWVSPKAGKRESRRFLGDYILTQTDLEAGRRFPDDIAYGGHDLDDHRPLGEGSNIFAFSIPPLYGIPYRACYSRNIANLYLAGRLISATHLAHASTRIMGSGAAVGQAVGLAAALCLDYGCLPRELGEQHLAALQDGLVATDATILCRPRADAGDLARQARVTATSEWRYNDQAPTQLVPLIAPAGIVLWDWPTRLRQVELYLKNDTDQEQELTLTVAHAQPQRRWLSMDEYHTTGWNDLRAAAFADCHAIRLGVPAGFAGWLAGDLGDLELPPKDPTGDDDRILISLSENPHVRWGLTGDDCEITQTVELSHHSPTWRPVGARGTLKLTPPPPLGEAANAVNGFHRRFGRGPTNLWLSDPRDGLPQELELQWDSPQRISRICLTFDNLERDSHANPWHAGTLAAGRCVRDYELALLTEQGWREVATVEGNVRRCRTHDCEPVTATALRLRVLATNESGWGARVYEVRVGSHL